MRLHELLAEAGLSARPVTRDPPFQAWFAGSKLVNPDGSPQVFYHGTSKDVDFKKFRVPGNGAWFTSSPTDASDYAAQNDNQDITWDPVRRCFQSTNTASRVLPAFIRATNPAVFEGLPDVLFHAGANSTSGVGYRRDQRAFFDRLRADGHDAALFRFPDQDMVVVLGGPVQVKSAIGNTKFLPTKPNMHEADHGI